MLSLCQFWFESNCVSPPGSPYYDVCSHIIGLKAIVVVYNSCHVYYPAGCAFTVLYIIPGKWEEEEEKEGFFFIFIERCSRSIVPPAK